MPRKLRILALHSIRSSGDIFARQVQRAGIATALQDLITVEYINAPWPAAIEPSPNTKSASARPRFQWYSASQNAETGIWTFDERQAWQSIDQVRRYAKEHGPYDGVLAMSQGAVLISFLLLYDMNAAKDQSFKPTVLGRFCIVMAGAYPTTPQVVGVSSESRRLPVPSVHLIGDKDPVKKESHRLMEMYENPLHIPHSQGHVVPTLNAAQLEQLRGFLKAQGAASKL
ncbi:hypothetical protein WJX73_006304 [Symbiochloris irregularis]|uniref:Serine hydrolase domain-containing protein n=1 Tax=Symbiochloris irregularis TaxID=706552 RepID=A0AAW1NUU5_9CHLO